MIFSLVKKKAYITQKKGKKKKKSHFQIIDIPIIKYTAAAYEFRTNDSICQIQEKVYFFILFYFKIKSPSPSRPSHNFSWCRILEFKKNNNKKKKERIPIAIFSLSLFVPLRRNNSNTSAKRNETNRTEPN